MNANQIALLRNLYYSGAQNTPKLAQACKLENSTTAYLLCGLRDLGYVVSDTKNQRGGSFATWTIIADGRDWMYRYIHEHKAVPTLSPEQEINKHLQASLAALRDDFAQVSDKLRAEKSINAELNALIRGLRTKLSAATTVKPVSGRHYFAVISQLQGSYTAKVVERFAREDNALRAAETYAQANTSETVSVCESKHLIQLEQVVNVKAVAKPI